MVMETFVDQAHARAERIVRNVFGPNIANWPDCLCGQIEKAILDARQDGAEAMRQAMQLATRPTPKP
jgi:hypothetical protein